MSNNYDHYLEARKIANSLEELGYESDAHKIRLAIDDGRSGTEIFMQLRSYITPFASDSSLPSHTRDQISVLLDEIQSALA